MLDPYTQIFSAVQFLYKENMPVAAYVCLSDEVVTSLESGGPGACQAVTMGNLKQLSGHSFQELK